MPQSTSPLDPRHPAGQACGVIDSHCHLADKKFAADLPAVLTRALAAGVDRMVTIGDSLAESKECVVLAMAHGPVFCTVGVHPHNAKDWTAGSAPELRRLVGLSPKVRAIGEIGLDYHYDNSPRDVQRAVFREQLELAAALALPAVVHCREAVSDVWSIVAGVRPAALVLHCCTERWEDVEKFVEAGYLLSFTGIATYAKSDEIRETIRRCPLDRMMVETDAPYLAPEPHRGKRNEPAYVLETAKAIAEVKGVPFAEVDRATTATAVAFFGLS